MVAIRMQPSGRGVLEGQVSAGIRWGLARSLHGPRLFLSDSTLPRDSCHLTDSLNDSHMSQLSFRNTTHTSDAPRSARSPTAPATHTANPPSPFLELVNEFLDRYILPWPVRYLTHRFVILLTIGLLVPLLSLADHTVLVLGINSYLNVMSAAVSSIVLLYTAIAEIRERRIAEMQEKRAQEDHAHVTEMHSLLLRAMASQNEAVEEIRRSLNELQGQPYVSGKSLAPVDLRALHPRGYRRFATNDLEQRWQQEVLQPKRR